MMAGIVVEQCVEKTPAHKVAFSGTLIPHKQVLKFDDGATGDIDIVQSRIVAPWVDVHEGFSIAVEANVDCGNIKTPSCIAAFTMHNNSTQKAKWPNNYWKFPLSPTWICGPSAKTNTKHQHLLIRWSQIVQLSQIQAGGIDCWWQPDSLELSAEHSEEPEIK